MDKEQRAQYMRQYRKRREQKEISSKNISAAQDTGRDWPAVIQSMSQRQRDALLAKINKSK